MATGYEHARATQLILGYRGGQMSADNTAELVRCCRALLDEHHRMIRAITAITQVWPAVRSNLNELNKLATQNVQPPERANARRPNPEGRDGGR